MKYFILYETILQTPKKKPILLYQGSPLHQVVEQTRAKLAQYRADIQCLEVQVVSNGNGGNRWRAPATGFVKVNFDGAIFGDSSMSGVGVVIRDTNGAVLASCAEKIGHAYKADETEALAALKALTLAHELGFQNVVFKGDALGLIQALKSQEQNLSLWGLLVEDVKVYGTKFRRLLYSHVKRNGNSVAHNLAKHVICILDFQVWMEDVPSHIVLFLHLDVSYLH